MAFPKALSSSAVDTLATMQLGTDCYLLVWGQNVVFKALINQSTFATSFATITWDTATIGAYTDALEGYTIWLSLTDDIRAYSWWGRLRSDATATTLNVEWNSFIPADDYFIFVTKDVRESTKTPFLSGSTWRTDYAISYHAPPPIIYDIPTFFFAQIDADGNADITITPNAYAIADGASISSWALTSTDGGSQVSFNASTGATVIRYTVAGDYMPRLTVTDSNGTTQWFSPFVKIAGDNLSGVVNLNFENITINADIQNGWNMTMPFFDGVANVLDGTMCAVYMPHNTAGNKILFCGRARTEDSDYTADGSGTSTFNVDGLASIMNNLNVISWRYKDTASPDDFSEITNVTPWRAIAAYIREMTNINNTHSLEFGDTSDDYIYVSYFFQRGTLLDSLRDQMWSINMDFDFTSDGMFKLVRNLRYQTEAERGSLTNVANFEFRHYSGDNADDIMYSLEKDHSYQVGKAISGCGWYNTTSKAVSFFAALSPPVQPGRGTEIVVTDRQILKADLSRADAETEGKRRSRNDFAAKQFLDTLDDIRIPGGFVGKFNPSVSDWYSHTITASDGIRRITYTASDRWLLTGLSLAWDNEIGQIVIEPTWQIESDDLGFAINIRNPLPTTFYDNPVMMPQASFPGLDYDPTIDFPTGATEGDEQPVTQEDTNPLDAAQDPATMVILNSTTIVLWSETQVQMTRHFGSTLPAWFDVTPSGIPSGHKIQEFVWDRFSDSGEGGYVIAHNEDLSDPDSRVYYNKGVGTLAYWSEATLDDMLTTQVRATAKGAVIVYGKFKTFAPAGGFPMLGLSDRGGTNDMSGDGIPDLLPSDQLGLVPDRSDYPGIYDSSSQVFKGGLSSNGGVGCNIKWAIPPGVNITSFVMQTRIKLGGGGNSGERWMTVQSTVGHASYRNIRINDFQISLTDSDNMPIAAGSQSHLYFHNSVDDDDGDAWIEGIRIDATAAADFSGTRHSTDNAANFDPPIGIGEMALNSGSMDMRYGGQVFATKDNQVRAAAIPGTGFFFTADQGTTSGKFAACLRKIDKNDYLLALDSLDGTTGLYKIINNSRTNITPDDGANYGIVVGIGGLANSPKDTAYVWALMTFGGVTNLAYSDDLGATGWSFNNAPTNNATWVDVNPRSITTIYVADGSIIWRSIDGGDNLVEFSSPISGLVGVAAL